MQRTVCATENGYFLMVCARTHKHSWQWKLWEWDVNDISWCILAIVILKLTEYRFIYSILRQITPAAASRCFTLQGKDLAIVQLRNYKLNNLLWEALDDSGNKKAEAGSGRGSRLLQMVGQWWEAMFIKMPGMTERRDTQRTLIWNLWWW